MQLILVRHALPHAVPAQPGVRADPSLTEQGHRQAQRLVGALAADDVSAVVASPAARALQTAAPLAATLGLEVVVRDGLREYDELGQGYVPFHVAVAQQLPDAVEIAAGRLPARVAEADFRARVVAAVEALATEHAGRRTVAVVCHGGVVNAYLGHVLGIERGMPFPIDYVGMSRVYASRDGRRRVRTVNESGHVWDILEPN